jgi:UDPglucose 6-dehydrogenase
MVLLPLPTNTKDCGFAIETPKSICCIGAGYVGVPTMVTIALNCPDIKVIVVDKNSERIDAWRSMDKSKFPLYEPGLADCVLKASNLFFSQHVSLAIQECDIIFVCVDTPTKTVGIGAGQAANLSPLESAARAISSAANRSKVVVEKSTVPVNTARVLEDILSATSVHEFVVLSNPEFLAEGSAMKDLQNPDRVLIGGPQTPSGLLAIKSLRDIYNRWVESERIITTNQWSSELSKLAANAFLAQRVSSINAISLICERTGADVEEVSRAIGSDSRIGSKFLTASVGFGGSCFKKDILNLVYIADGLGLHAVGNYWKSVLEINSLRQQEFLKTIVSSMHNTLSGKILAVFGLSFKKDTSDTRESPSLAVCEKLIDEGAVLHVYDPQVTQTCVESISSKNPIDAVRGAHAIIILTEWDEFTRYDYGEFFRLMMKPAYVFDGRNILDHKTLTRIGFTVKAIGKTIDF